MRSVICLAPYHAAGNLEESVLGEMKPPADPSAGNREQFAGQTRTGGRYIQDMGHVRVYVPLRMFKVKDGATGRARGAALFKTVACAAPHSESIKGLTLPSVKL